MKHMKEVLLYVAKYLANWVRIYMRKLGNAFSLATLVNYVHKSRESFANHLYNPEAKCEQAQFIVRVFEPFNTK